MSDVIVVEVPTVELAVLNNNAALTVEQLTVESIVVEVPTVEVLVQEQITQIDILSIGEQGAKGDKGDSAFFYRHTQSAALAVWTIDHNLNCYPTAVVFDSGGNQCEGIFAYPSLNQMTITFSAAFAGVANVI